MIDRRLLKNFDWSILFIALAISLVGVMTIYSATRPVLGAEHQSYHWKQFYWIGLSLICFFAAASVDYTWLIRFAYIIFIGGVVVLIAVLVFGVKGMGAQRWLPLGFFSFQPSEIFKIIFVIAVSRYLSDRDQHLAIGFRELVIMPLIFFLVPAILILKQPHLGAVMILLLIFLSMIVIAGTKKRIIIVSIIIALISVPFVGNIFWGGLKEHQKQRIMTFVDPYIDPHGIGYHIKQSKVSIGSGGFIGKCAFVKPLWSR